MRCQKPQVSQVADSARSAVLPSSGSCLYRAEDALVKKKICRCRLSLASGVTCTFGGVLAHELTLLDGMSGAVTTCPLCYKKTR